MGRVFPFSFGMWTLLAARIVGEEKVLLRELEGFAEYQRRVRFRLIPGVW